MARSFKDYIDDYNRKAFGAGSDKDPATDRFSGLDVRKMFDAGTDKYDLSKREAAEMVLEYADCLLYTSPSPRDKRQSRMPSSA